MKNRKALHDQVKAQWEKKIGGQVSSPPPLLRISIYPDRIDVHFGQITVKDDIKDAA